MGSMRKSSLRIQSGQTIERMRKVDWPNKHEPPILNLCKEFNVFSLRATVLPLTIQVLASQTARGSSSLKRRSNGQWETRSGNTNIRGPDIGSTKGEETLGGMTGTKVIFKSEGCRGVESEVWESFVVLGIVPNPTKFYSLPQRLGRPSTPATPDMAGRAMKVRGGYLTNISSRAMRIHMEHPLGSARANRPVSASRIGQCPYREWGRGKLAGHDEGAGQSLINAPQWTLGAPILKPENLGHDPLR